MSDDVYILRETAPGVEDYRRLRVDAGLEPRSAEAAERGLAGTWFGVSIEREGQIVAMGRIIGDGGCFFQIVDIAVHPDHQRRGLGKRILKALSEHLERSAPESAFVSLLADGDAHLALPSVRLRAHRARIRGDVPQVLEHVRKRLVRARDASIMARWKR